MEEIKNILIDFCKVNFKTDCDWYHWEINEDVLPKGIELPKGKNVNKNVSLKEQLHSKWSQSDIKIKGELIEYYIVQWGGIKSNNKETLTFYKTKPAEELINLGVKGVSSWSKALVLHDSNKYAIFDSRVSCSLNYLQIINESNNKILFPILPSRNNKISSANKYLKQISKNWVKLKNDKFYELYLSLLNETAKDLNTNISMIEMLLFAKATELIDKV
ncbi:MAG: hypothetical protein ACOVQC_06410 [Flavobacterium sp.]